jgi:hypothetical protein
VSSLLAKNSLAQSETTKPSYVFLSTDAPERFTRVGKIFLGRAPDHVELVDIQG